MTDEAKSMTAEELERTIQKSLGTCPFMRAVDGGPAKCRTDCMLFDRKEMQNNATGEVQIQFGCAVKSLADAIGVQRDLMVRQLLGNPAGGIVGVTGGGPLPPFRGR